jgi:type VI secretion system secreted protein Hcp
MASTDFFLKIDGIPGESQDSQHQGEIEIDSFSWGATQQGTGAAGGGGGAGKAAFQDIHFASRVSKASVPLAIACATGQHIKKVVLTVRKAGGKQEEYYKVTLTDVLISSYQTGGSEGANALPVDQFALNFADIEFEYKEQRPDGSLAAPVKARYDLKANTAR